MPKQSKKPELIDRNKVKYNVVLNKNNKPLKKTNKKLTFKEAITIIFKTLKNNIHIIFNSVLLFIYLIFLYGLIMTKIFSTTINIYIIAIALFFILLAISYNKYLSGKVFSIILSLIMIISILYMNNTYGYINRLNTSYYETKTYYIVTFDNNTNKSIYNINNKTIGLLKSDSSTKGIINNKIAGANYVIYDNENNLYSDFYTEKTRAIVLNENEYIYLLNNIEKNTHKIKVLDTFTTSAKI